VENRRLSQEYFYKRRGFTLPPLVNRMSDLTPKTWTPGKGWTTLKPGGQDGAKEETAAI
jgi:hypothetical protein